MINKMPTLGVVGGNSGITEFPEPKVTDKIQVYSSRAEIVKGGYTIMGGICFLDITVKVLTASTSNNTKLTNIPTLAKNLSVYCYEIDATTDEIVTNGSWDCYYDTSDKFHAIRSRSSVTANKTYRLKAIYLTDDSDT